jgi:hypothetical protein
VVDNQTPAISKALVEWLSHLFPDHCPDPAMSDREVWMEAGAAKVVRKLRIERERQTNSHNVLENK